MNVVWKANPEFILAKLRQQLYRRHVHTTAQLEAVFDAVEVSGDGMLSKRELEACLAHYGLFLDKPELSTLARYFDANGDGQISKAEFLGALRVPLSDERAVQVQAAWELVSGGAAAVPIDEAMTHFRAERAQLVLEGSMPAAAARANFASAMRDFSADGDGQTLTRAGFFSVYAEVSACMPSDEVFSLHMTQVWDIHLQDEMALLREELCGILRVKVPEKVAEYGREADKLRQALVYFDHEDTGSVSRAQFAAAMQRFGLDLSEAQLDAFCQPYGDEWGGEIPIEPFVRSVGLAS